MSVSTRVTIELIERGEDLAREAQQVRPVGTALQDLQAIGARATFLVSRSTNDDEATAMVIAEAVRSAYARGIRNAMAAGFQPPHWRAA
jgi:hypothetical protein